ncbi:hypothetical protein [Pseudomonas glycinae]|uniref:hypothetical protein n=1 Tax=Pseudomonas glycinae TaxID=1785145 RepID=UPI001F3A1776|nr:hypothetical protein [Pseudomonas glycinae]
MKAFITVFILCCLSACAHPPPSTLTTPTVVLYGRGGIVDLNCRISLTPGTHKLGITNSCKQDNDFHFVIENPREGVSFTFFADEDCIRNPPDNLNLGNIKYRIVDPIHGQPTDMTGIDQGRGVTPGTEINPGIVLVEGSLGLPPVEGRDKCILVSD